MDRIGNKSARQEFMRNNLPELLTDKSVMTKLLCDLAVGGQRARLRYPELFAREVSLYLDPRGRFSVQLFFHSPGEYTVIHDHTTWGVIGAAVGSVSIMEYSIKKQISERRVEFLNRRQTFLKPGEVALVKPGYDGIHQTGSPDETVGVTISVYGRPGRRGYINTFDAETGLIRRRYPIRALRRRLARRALEGLGVE
jgi:predicted metal-dependent enzyme (double-stranded beta helix superfamily)